MLAMVKAPTPRFPDLPLCQSSPIFSFLLFTLPRFGCPPAFNRRCCRCPGLPPPPWVHSHFDSGPCPCSSSRSLQVDFSMSGKRSEEHTSELQSLMRISYAVFCLKKKTINLFIIHIDKL